MDTEFVKKVDGKDYEPKYSHFPQTSCWFDDQNWQNSSVWWTRMSFYSSADLTLSFHCLTMKSLSRADHELMSVRWWSKASSAVNKREQCSLNLCSSSVIYLFCPLGFCQESISRGRFPSFRIATVWIKQRLLRSTHRHFRTLVARWRDLHSTPTRNAAIADIKHIINFSFHVHWFSVEGHSGFSPSPWGYTTGGSPCKLEPSPRVTWSSSCHSHRT